MTLSLTGAAPQALALRVIGISRIDLPFKRGVMVPNLDMLLSWSHPSGIGDLGRIDVKEGSMNSRDKPRDLSTSERILRLQDEWDDIAGNPAELDLTPEQLEELHRRLEDHRRNPRPYKTWEEVREELERLGRHDPD